MKNKNSLNDLMNDRWDDLKEFFIALAIVFAARASMIFLLNYSGDDYLMANSQVDEFHFWVCQGRFQSYVIDIICELLGARFPFMGGFWSIFATASYVAYGLILRRLWAPCSSSLVALSIVLIFSLFPYQSDFITFHECAPSTTVSLLLGGISLMYCDKGGWKTIICALGLFLAISYPPFVVLFAITILIMGLMRFNDFIKTKSSSVSLRVLLAPVMFRLGFFVVIVFLSLLINHFVQKFSGIPMQERGEIITFKDAPDKAVMFIKQLQFFLLRPEVSFPVAVKLLQLSLLLAVFFGALRQMLHSGKKTNQIIGTMFFISCLVTLAAAATIAPYFILKNYSGCMSLRMIAGFSVFWAGIFSAAWIFNEGKMKAAVLCIGLIVSVSYAFKVNEQSSDFARINLRDHLVANRIIERLSLFPGENKIRTVVFVGNKHLFNLNCINTETSGFNVSSLYLDWSNTKLLSEVSSQPFLTPSAEDIKTATADAKGKPVWPDAQSVYIKNDIGIVVLGFE
jgi:hypothetical protein